MSDLIQRHSAAERSRRGSHWLGAQYSGPRYEMRPWTDVAPGASQIANWLDGESLPSSSADYNIDVLYYNHAVHLSGDRRTVVQLPERMWKQNTLVQIEDWLTDQSLAVIRARDTESASDLSHDSRRLSHDVLRRGSSATLLIVIATQAIYFLTGFRILHPAVAVLIMVIASVFYYMSVLMGREISVALVEL